MPEYGIIGIIRQRGDLDSYIVIQNYINNVNNEVLCLDCNKVIMNECGRNTSGDFYRIYSLCYDRIQHVSENISDEFTTKLKELGFHEASDLCYVGVALNADRIIITLDGDYGLYPDDYYRSEDDARAKHNVAEYMKCYLNLNVFTSEMYLDYHI